TSSCEEARNLHGDAVILAVTRGTRVTLTGQAHDSVLNPWNRVVRETLGPYPVPEAESLLDRDPAPVRLHVIQGEHDRILVRTLAEHAQWNPQEALVALHAHVVRIDRRGESHMRVADSHSRFEHDVAPAGFEDDGDGVFRAGNFRLEVPRDTGVCAARRGQL